ncbi:MAG: hypothetical protein EPO21_06750 [Chloroflexota bacterium]|nr:MAG: hypothetical protein EPO21_06750 [Chloroflexota bacterium]
MPVSALIRGMKVVRKKTKALLLAVGGSAAGLLLLFLLLAVLLVEGYPMPGELYYIMSRSVKSLPSTRVMTNPGPVPSPLPSAQGLRDIAFDWYNIRPQARQWMAGLKIQYRDMVEWGSFDPRNNSISISEPYVPVVIHEFAHANFQHKPVWNKLTWAADMLRLWYDENPRNAEAREVLREELAVALHFAEEGKQYNPILETYAHLAELSGGDLTALPSYVRKHFADYLRPGPTAWTAQGVGGIEQVDISSLAIGP